MQAMLHREENGSGKNSTLVAGAGDNELRVIEMPLGDLPAALENL